MAAQRRLVSRLTAGRIVWGVLASVAFVAAAAAAVRAAVAEVSVPSVLLALILAALAGMAIVLSLDGVTQGILRVGPRGYATHLTRLHPWSAVLDIGTAAVEGRPVPAVALRSMTGFVVEQDMLRGFAAEETGAVLAALTDAAPELPGFSEVVLDAAWWATVEAEAERAVGVVRAATGREPETRERVAFGFPGLISAIRLDYGFNDAGERVEVYVRQGLDLALTVDDRRWLRQHRRRSRDAAAQVAVLLGEHQVRMSPSSGTGFDRLRLMAPGERPITFNAEEPDRYSAPAH
ncbi:MAG: hypothetical protein ACK5LS_05630 [Propioniciclava sp.]